MGSTEIVVAGMVAGTALAVVAIAAAMVGQYVVVVARAVAA